MNSLQKYKIVRSDRSRKAVLVNVNSITQWRLNAMQNVYIPIIFKSVCVKYVKYVLLFRPKGLGRPSPQTKLILHNLCAPFHAKFCDRTFQNVGGG